MGCVYFNNNETDNDLKYKILTFVFDALNSTFDITATSSKYNFLAANSSIREAKPILGTPHILAIRISTVATSNFVQVLT